MFDPSVPGCFRPLTRQEIQAERLPKPDPVDVFRDNPTEKLRRMRLLKDEDGTLALALDAIWHFFYGDRDKQGNLLLSRDCRYDCGVDLYYELSSYLLDEERWAKAAILNVACSGKFTSDRTIQEYVDDIWHLDKVTLKK